MLASFLLTQGAGKLADMVKGKAANMAVDAIADKLGVDRNEDAIERHLTAHPEEMVKLEQLDVERLSLEIQDRENAREMQKEALKSNDPWVRRFVYLFAWFWAVASVGYFFAVTFVDLPENNNTFANYILGFLTGTAVATIIGFFYGGATKEDKQ